MPRRVPPPLFKFLSLQSPIFLICKLASLHVTVFFSVLLFFFFVFSFSAKATRTCLSWYFECVVNSVNFHFDLKFFSLLNLS